MGNRTGSPSRRPLRGRDKEHGGAAGILSSAGAGLLGIVVGLALLPLVIATIGSGAYGLWLLVSAVSVYLQYADVGVGSAIVHFGSRSRAGVQGHTFSQYVSGGLMWNMLVATAVVPLFAVLAIFITSSNAGAAGVSSADANALALLATLMLACLLVSPFASALIGSGLLPVERRNQSIGIAVRCAGTLTACLVFDSIVWLAAAEVIAAITPHGAAVIALARRKLLKISFRHGAFSALRKMLRYSIRSFGVALVGATILQLGTVVVGSLMGPSDVTYYNAAFRVYTAARQLLTWIVDPFRSTLSRQFVEDPPRARRILTTLCAAAFGASALGAGVLVFGASDIVHLWLGASVPTATISLTMIVLLVGFVVNAIQIPLVPAGDALGRPGAFFLIQLTWLVAFAALVFPLVHSLGIVGAALALSAPLALIAPLYLWRARSVLELGADDWRASGIFAIFAIVSASAILAFVAAVIQFFAGLEPLSFYSTLTFAVSAVVFAIVLRNHLPTQRIRELLRAKL